MDEILRSIDESNSMTLAEVAQFLEVDEERAEGLARQGLIRASEERDGWRFERLSVAAYRSEEAIRRVRARARQFSEDLAEAIEEVAAMQYERGEIAGAHHMGRRIAEELDAVIKSYPEDPA